MELITLKILLKLSYKVWTFGLKSGALSLLRGMLMMKKVFVASLVFAAWSAIAHEEHGTSHEQHGSGWEMGLALGTDYGENRAITAVSVSAPLPVGHGYRAVFEYAKGTAGDVTEMEEGEPVTKHERASDVYSLKVSREFYSIGHLEFGAAAGIAHLSAASREGNGTVWGLEAAYPITSHVSAKVEVSRFYGYGAISDYQANVVQAGLAYKF
jgi:hypothetical protein